MQHPDPHRFLILHGSYGTPQENWFPWLAQALRLYGHEVIVPSFPTPQDQTPEIWMDIVAKTYGPLTHKTILVGHSTGAGFALWLLNHSKITIKAAYLVAGFTGQLRHPVFDPLNAPFFAQGFDWQVLKNKAAYIQCYAGENDPYVPLPLTQTLAESLDAPLTVISGGGHLNSQSGFSQFEQLRDDILKNLRL